MYCVHKLYIDLYVYHVYKYTLHVCKSCTVTKKPKKHKVYLTNFRIHLILSYVCEGLYTCTHTPRLFNNTHMFLCEYSEQNIIR